MDSTRERLWDRGAGICVFASTFLFGLLAHGYRYFNLLYSHDSLLVYHKTDVGQMVGVGRIMVPVYLQFRGDFYPPLLVGVLSLVFLAGTAYLTVRMLGLKNKALICLTCGIFATSVTLTLINATYIKDADVYMLALLLTVAAVYLCDRYRFGLFGAAALVCMSLGLYQAMFQAGVFLAMLLAVKRILERRGLKEVLLAGFKEVAAFLLGLVVYAAALRTVLRATRLELTDSYNGLGGVGQFSGMEEVLRLIAGAYKYPAKFFLRPETVHSQWMAVLNVLLLCAAGGLLVYLAVVRRVRGWDLAVLAAVVVLMPFGMDVVYFISKGVIHLLMVFSFYFVYPGTAMLLEQFLREAGGRKISALTRRVLGRAAPCAMAILIFNSVVYANQVYLKKDLEYQTTMLTMVRLIDRMEQVEGYVPGETRVALLGRLEDSGLFLPREGMAGLNGTGLEPKVGLTYFDTYYWYFHHILSYPISLMGPSKAMQFGQRDEVKDMPAFPALGSCRMVDGVLVVKLS